MERDHAAVQNADLQLMKPKSRSLLLHTHWEALNMSRREQNPNKSDETEELANEFDEKAALNESNARDNGANEEEVLDEKAAMRQGDEIDALLTDTPPASRYALSSVCSLQSSWHLLSNY